ncbi:MAG: two-component sensor histidine kinase [Chloroflexi bacterium]|nr:two-component sensor histidine kinase [Chloroflexota bacterium]MDB5074912.1 two-component sensor histidine kinase [Chloroflexota bacterium]
MNDLALNDEQREWHEARLDIVPESMMENTEFFSTLSHELRTPLATIKGFAQTLIAHWDDLPSDRRRRHVEYILRSTLRLERLVGDLSTSSRLVDGISVLPGHVEAFDVLTQAVGEAQVLYPNRVFRLESPDADQDIWADRDRLLQVVINLLDNAAKYSPAAEPIILRWFPDGPQVRVEVYDAGTSLTLEEQGRLFTRYCRLGRSKQADGIVAGSGLGLYICKSLIEAMNGHIGIETDEAGSGNTFWFTVPNRAA